MGILEETRIKRGGLAQRLRGEAKGVDYWRGGTPADLGASGAADFNAIALGGPASVLWV